MKGSHSRRRFFAGLSSENHYLCADANTLFILAARSLPALSSWFVSVLQNRHGDNANSHFVAVLVNHAAFSLLAEAKQTLTSKYTHTLVKRAQKTRGIYLLLCAANNSRTALCIHARAAQSSWHDSEKIPLFMQQVGFISMLVLDVKLIVFGSATLQAGQVF